MIRPHRWRGLIALILVAAALLPTAMLRAQSAGQEPLVAGVDRMSLTTDDILEYTVIVTVDGTNVPRPQVPNLDGFYVAGTNSTTQLSIVNGVVTNNVIYRYRLQPYQTGELVIGSARLELDGQIYETEPITIQVTQGTGQTSGPGQSQTDFQAPSQLGDNDLFVEALVDNAEPYVGQQIHYIFRYYEAADALRPPSLFAGQPNYEPPSLTGFWSEGDTDVISYRVAVDGRIYTVTELTNILFPTAAGEVTIEPGRIVLPGMGFQGDTTLQTDPVTVQVKALPPGAPDSFSGAVGQFDLAAEVDTALTKVDEPITFSVTLSGRGNIGTAGEPQWPDLPGWRSFASDSSLTTSIEDGNVDGVRVFEHLLVPTVTGGSILPPIEYTYFDPATTEYVTISSDPIEVVVEPGVGNAALAPAAALAETGIVDMANVDAAPKSAQALKAAPVTMVRNTKPLTSQWWYWALWSMPLAVLAGGMAWQRRQTYLHQNADYVRSSQASKQAHKALAALARRATGDGAGLADAHQILTDYLAAKLQRTVTGLTRGNLGARLLDRGVDELLVQRTQACLDAADRYRYSPVGTFDQGTEPLLAEIGDVINRLEQVL